ncbi:MAG: hypothetical protein GY718_10665 [Lentisphaerae bacterium]|nr:hypothetical protein [Lentisphaerota bacterium]
MLMEVGQIEGIECELSPYDIVRYVAEQVNILFKQWVGSLEEEPENFASIERKILQFTNIIAGLLTAAVLASNKTKERIKGEAKEIRCESGKKWRFVRGIWLKTTLLCGLTISVYTPYWLPRRPAQRVGRPRGSGKRGKEGTGLYPELAALGIREGISPSLQEEIARTAIYMPSFKICQQELEHRGINVDVKKVRRVTSELGEQALSARKKDIELWKQGELPAGTEFNGKCVVAAIDGGRTRTRKNHLGRKTKNGRHKFKTDWREPKILAIYVVDENGKRNPDDVQIIDTGLKGPEQIAELAAFHLHRLGAADAEEVIFLADGAEWIWDRVPMIAQKAGLKHWLAGLDFCHVMGYVGKAVKAAYQDKTTRKTHVKKIRKALLTGKVEKALSILQDLPDADTTDDIQIALRYIRNRRLLMKYDHIKAKGLPIGSGAVESAVRRVINLRIKSPGMFWEEDNVEAFMYLRANALSGQWDNMLNSVHQYTRTTRKRDWKWNLTPYSIKAEENKNFQLSHLVNREAA